jgi:hypothetical protein
MRGEDHRPEAAAPSLTGGEDEVVEDAAIMVPVMEQCLEAGE